MLRASAALQGIKASEARLAKAQRLAQLGNWDWDIRQDHWQGSAEWYRLLGVPPSRIVTAPAWWRGYERWWSIPASDGHVTCWV